eukprot:2632097-Alexandrium_andersonii.AAC.1
MRTCGAPAAAPQLWRTGRGSAGPEPRSPPPRSGRDGGGYGADQQRERPEDHGHRAGSAVEGGIGAEWPPGDAAARRRGAAAAHQQAHR